MDRLREMQEEFDIKIKISYKNFIITKLNFKNNRFNKSLSLRTSSTPFFLRLNRTNTFPSNASKYLSYLRYPGYLTLTLRQKIKIVIPTYPVLDYLLTVNTVR